MPARKLAGSGGKGHRSLAYSVSNSIGVDSGVKGDGSVAGRYDAVVGSHSADCGAIADIGTAEEDGLVDRRVRCGLRGDVARDAGVVDRETAVRRGVTPGSVAAADVDASGISDGSAVGRLAGEAGSTGRATSAIGCLCLWRVSKVYDGTYA